MHKTLRLQLPDLRYLDCKVDFSIKTFNAVMQLCKELGKYRIFPEFYLDVYIMKRKYEI